MRASCQSLAGNCSSGTAQSDLPDRKEIRPIKPAPSIREESPRTKKGAIGGGDSGSGGDEQSSSSDGSEQSSDGERSDEDAPLARTRARAPPAAHVRNARRTRVVGRQWVASLSARSNQDGQRRFEERAARTMRAALARRHPASAPAPPTPLAAAKSAPGVPPGGVYARLEAEWRERTGAGGGAGGARRPAASARARPPPQPAKYK